MRISPPALALTLFLAGIVRAVCPVGDLSRNCKVDFDDIRLFSEQWLAESGCAGPDCADMDSVDGVNMFDFALLTRHWRQKGHPIVINEFMASNTKFVEDPQGQCDDWLELYNAGDQTIDVGRMYLTNNLSEKMKWRIPDGVTIPAYSHLWIWADEDTQHSPGLHAGFKIDADGGQIGLFDSNGTTLVDSIAFDRQTSDISFGRFPDGSRNWRFLGVPTPQGENDGAYLGEVEDPEFSHERGFYDSPILVTIATETDGVRLYYTLDGLDPHTSTGRQVTGTLYSDPVPISTTKSLRAKAVKPGWKSSRIKTNTYIFNAPDAIKSLPIVSLVGDDQKTFYEPDGIMAIVGGYYSGGVWTSDGPGSYNNVLSRGMAYERPVSFEFFNTNDDSDLQVDCGIRIHGSPWMRPRYRRCAGNMPLGWTGDCKFSFRLYFRGMYGDSRLDHPLFPYGLDEFESIVLRGGHNDRVNPFIKDELIRRLHMDMGNAASTGTNANLFINGQYKGYFNPCEHIKDSFCQEYYRSDEEWDVMTMNGIRDGDSASWNEMISYARNHDLSIPVHYSQVAGRLDIPAFADYLILQLWSGNWDWPQNNWAAASERSDQGIWRFFIWDAEGGMFSNTLNTVYFDRLNTQSNGNAWLYRALKVNNDFKQVFTDRLCKHFYNNGALTEANITERFLELRDQMSAEIPNMDMYVLDTWVPNRLAIFLNACRTEGMFTYTGPEFRINDVYQHGGYASIGDSLRIFNTNGVGHIYYTVDGADPRVPAATWLPGDIVTFVPEDAAKRMVVPTGPLASDTGLALYEYWTNIDGGAVSDLTSHPDYPAKPTGSYYVNSFEGPSHWNDYYGSRISGYVHPPAAGSYTFWLATDDNGELWLSTNDDPANKNLIASVPGWTAPRVWDTYPQQRSAPIALTGGQKYYIEAMMKEGGGGDNIAVTWRGPGIGFDPPVTNDPPIAGQYLSAPGNLWATLDYDDSGFQYLPSGTAGVGYETRPSDAVNYLDLIDMDVQAQMHNKNTTCYIRIPFIATTLEIMHLTLNIRYDDGFVAYINGDKVAARNFDGAPAWDSHADAGRPDSQAVYFESIDLSDHTDSLRLGENILAIQGLNVSSGSSDFLISAELLAHEAIVRPSGSISPTAIKYDEPWTLSKTTQVKARMLYGDTWSAVTEATYAVGPVAESLRITEIMYHPQFTGDPNDPNTEFIELKNIGPETLKINLNLVRFTNGIDFTFGDIELAGGECLVVVKDLAAFNAAHPGFSGVIAGEYLGSLNNAGERIELVDAAGRTVLDFKYEDDWRSITDGGGYSLTAIQASDSGCYVSDDGLIGRWKLDDGAGAVAIDSVGSNHGAVVGSPIWTAGRISGALTFDGKDDYILLDSINALTSDSVTVEAWVCAGHFADIMNPVLTQHSWRSSSGYYFYLYDRGYPSFSLIAGANDAQALSPDAIEAGRWHHIAGTNDGSNLRIYVDGSLRDSASSAGLTGVDYAAYIGYDLADPTYYSGLIDDVRVYNRALGEYEFEGIGDLSQRWGRKNSWRPSAYLGGSPGDDDSGIVPNPGSVVINEILAHSHATADDWIELYNTTDAAIDISGWYLSDSQIDLKKYKFADGTEIGAGNYLVLTEHASFGILSSDPGKITGFAFSENGDQAYLSSAEAGVLTGYRAVEDFGASQTGISFGRYFKRSTGNYNFVPMDHSTSGEKNAYPAVGPIVISEIMYNPDWPVGGSYANDRYEYIELHNITASDVKLYRDDKALPWKFTAGIDFIFRDSPDEVTIPPYDYIVVVRDVNAFTWRYPGVPAEKIFGPYEGQLSNGGERVELSMPGDIDKYGRRHYIRIDRVAYSDGLHHDDVPGGVDLWPTEADAGGKSLTRTAPALYGNDPNNWTAAAPTPGAANP